MTSPTCSQLHALAHRLDGAFGPATSRSAMREVAAALRELAEANLVNLPKIDPAHDDVAHWRGLDDHRLASENAADAWNLAAGLHVVAERAAQAEAEVKRAAVIL